MIFYEHLLSARHRMVLSQALCHCTKVLLGDWSPHCWQLSCQTCRELFLLVTAFIECHTLTPTSKLLVPAFWLGIGSPDGFIRSLVLVYPDLIWSRVIQAPWWQYLLFYLICPLLTVVSNKYYLCHCSWSVSPPSLLLCAALAFPPTDCHFPSAS